MSTPNTPPARPDGEAPTLRELYAAHTAARAEAEACPNPGSLCMCTVTAEVTAADYFDRARQKIAAV